MNGRESKRVEEKRREKRIFVNDIRD